MKSTLRAGLLLAFAASATASYAQGISGTTAASSGVTTGVKPSLSTDIPSGTPAASMPATAAPATPAPATAAPNAVTPITPAPATTPATTPSTVSSVTVAQPPTQLAQPQMARPQMMMPLSAKQKAALQLDYDLFNAANAGETWRIRELLGKGARIEAADWQYGFTPLMWAAKNGHLGAVRYLLTHGAKVNAKSKTGVRLVFEDKDRLTDNANGMTYWTALVSESGGITALDAATAGGWGLAARELILRGADVNATNPDGDTPLMAAAYHDDLMTVKELLAKGAKADATDRYGRGALWLAAWHGSENVVRELLARGVKPAADGAGVWPGDAARMARNNGIVAMLARSEKMAKAAALKDTRTGESTPGNGKSGAPTADTAMTRSTLAGKGGIIILN